MSILIPQPCQELLKKITPIIRAIEAEGGTSYFVGGVVRDLVLGRSTKDFDIEVHGLTLQQLRDILGSFGQLHEIGKKFGVLIIAGLPIDWALPRRDSSGRKPTVTIVPDLSLQEALQRRDLTMNAMALSVDDLLVDGSPTAAFEQADILDPFGGLMDIQAKRLRAVDPHFFIQDPLRFFRVMQFAARFEMAPDEPLCQICATMSLYDSYDDRPLAIERIQDELRKMFLRSRTPSLGFVWLAKIGRLQELFPWLAVVVNLDGAYAALDRASLIAVEDEGLKYSLMLAALWVCVRGEEPKRTSLAKDLALMISDGSVVDLVVLLVSAVRELYSLAVSQEDLPAASSFVVSDREAVVSSHVQIKRLAGKLGERASVAQVLILYQVLYAPGSAVETLAWWRAASEAGVLDVPEQPLVTGKMLLQHMPPGPHMGHVLARAYELQISKNILDARVLIELVLKDEGITTE